MSQIHVLKSDQSNARSWKEARLVTAVPQIPVAKSPWLGVNEEDKVLLAAVEKPEDPSEVFPHWAPAQLLRPNSMLWFIFKPPENAVNFWNSDISLSSLTWERGYGNVDLFHLSYSCIMKPSLLAYVAMWSDTLKMYGSQFVLSFKAKCPTLTSLRVYCCCSWMM